MILNGHELTPEQRRVVDMVATGDQKLFVALRQLLDLDIVEQVAHPMMNGYAYRYRLMTKLFPEWSRQKSAEEA